jgi:hypothetical protein
MYPKLPNWDDDHWPAIEIDQLKEDLEEAQTETSLSEDRSLMWHRKYKEYNRLYDSLKSKFEIKVTQVNHGLKDKCMTLLDLIDLYERAIIPPARGSSTDAKLLLKIKHLRKKGELDV